MSDHDESPEPGDPLLVRPYISDLPDPGPTTWPASATRPARHAAESHRHAATRTIALPGAAPARGGKRRTAVLTAGVAVAVLALGVTGYAMFGPGDSRTETGGALSAPTLSTRPNAGDPVPSSAIAPSGTSAPSAPAPSASASASAPRSAAAVAPVVSAPWTFSTSTVRPQPPATTGSTLSAAPTADRLVTIVSPGGFCLDLNGGVAADGNHVQIADCNGTDAQRWTLGADGTLRVVGRCAEITADASVRISGCDSRAGEQWRTGPQKSLVNPGSGLCLTDPEDGTTIGRALLAQSCTGRDAQRWTVP